MEEQNERNAEKDEQRGRVKKKKKEKVAVDDARSRNATTTPQ